MRCGAEAEGHAKLVVAATASAYLLRAMKINPLPAGFAVPAEAIEASRPPSGADWVHEIRIPDDRPPGWSYRAALQPQR
jgi:hypothetical protein